jgi:hypothetical protein
MQWQATPYGLGDATVGDTVDLTLAPDDEAAMFDAGVLALPPLFGYSFGRLFGQNAATTLPAATWTLVPLIAAGEWQTGDDCFTLVPTGQYAGAIQCTRAGLYSLGGSVIFDPANQTGDRGVRVTELAGSESGFLGFITSGAMLKVAQAPMLVAGQAELNVGDVMGLQAYASVPTATVDNPNSEWLSVAWWGN